MSETPQPLISVCVPTHHGRRDSLRALLESISEQAGGLQGPVEVCVSDNASRDGTQDMVRGLVDAAACPIRYHRRPADEGLAPNLLGAVELARGRYCWLLGSDDLLAEGALASVGRMLVDLPGATGYVVAAVHVDADRPELRSRALARAFYPSARELTYIDGVDRIYDECGNAWCALSWSIVERSAWLRASERQAARVRANPVFPQIVVLAAMAAERPRWGWLPEPLVHQRNATTFLFEGGGISLAARWTRIISAVAAAWGAALGQRGGVRWRRRMRRVHEVWGASADIRATKLYERPTVIAQARLALACLFAFWPSPAYWRDVFTASVMPVWLTRARFGFAGRRRSKLSEPAMVSLSGSLPAEIRASAVTTATVRVYNHGPRSIPTEGYTAVKIGQEWSTRSGSVLSSVAMGLNGAAADPHALPRRVRSGDACEVEVPIYAPPEPGSYRLRLVARQHGHGQLGEPGGSWCVEGAVEVRPGPT